jgi:hypothetical protein
MMQHLLDIHHEIDANDGRFTLVENASIHVSKNRTLYKQPPEDLYYDLNWVDIPFDIQSAYTVLGYNQNSWDNGIEVDADTVDWAELTPEQQEAALFIGY